MFSKQNLAQFAKYMAGGGVYFWTGYAVFAICYSGFHWNWLPSKIAADAIGWTLNYIVQRFWTFAGQHHPACHSVDARWFGSRAEIVYVAERERGAFPGRQIRRIRFARQ